MSEEKKIEAAELKDEEMENVNGGFGYYAPVGAVQVVEVVPVVTPVVTPIVYGGYAPAPSPVDYRPRPYQVGTCNQCAVNGHMNTPLYSVPGTDTSFCVEDGHIFKGGSFAYTDRDEARRYFG